MDDDDVSAYEDLGYRMDPEIREDITKREAIARSRPSADESMFARLLANAPKPPPAPSATTCAVCGHQVRPHYYRCPQCEGRANRRKVDALAEVIRELKGGRASGERERHLVKQLYEFDHPDPKGLLDCLAAARARGAGGGNGKL